MTKIFDQSDCDSVRRCLASAVDGPFFDEWEFQTLFGVQRQDVRSVLERWPDVDFSDESVVLILNNTFANLLGYPHRTNLHVQLGIDELGLSALYQRVRAALERVE